MKHKTIDKIGRIITDSLLVMLLIAMLVLPASSMSLVKYNNKQSVLSSKNVRNIKEDETKSIRDNPSNPTRVQRENFSSRADIELDETEETTLIE